MTSRTKAQLESLLAASQAECLALRHKINELQQAAMTTRPLFNDTTTAHREWLSYVTATRKAQRAEGRKCITYKTFNQWLDSRRPAH